MKKERRSLGANGIEISTVRKQKCERSKQTSNTTCDLWVRVRINFLSNVGLRWHGNRDWNLIKCGWSGKHCLLLSTDLSFVWRSQNFLSLEESKLNSEVCYLCVLICGRRVPDSDYLPTAHQELFVYMFFSKTCGISRHFVFHLQLSSSFFSFSLVWPCGASFTCLLFANP